MVTDLEKYIVKFKNRKRFTVLKLIRQTNLKHSEFNQAFKIGGCVVWELKLQISPEKK